MYILQGVYTLFLLISRPPKLLGVPSWSFLNSPFCVDFKTQKNEGSSITIRCFPKVFTRPLHQHCQHKLIPTPNILTQYLTGKRVTLWLSIQYSKLLNMLFISITARVKPHRHDSIMSAGYYVSRRCDTSLEASFIHRKYYLADVLYLKPCNSMCIRSKIQFQFFFEQKKVFLKFRII